jgi:hypothetical protein
MDQDVPAHDDEIAEVEATSIIVQCRLRPIRESVVNELVASIKELGLICPITIKADWGGGRPILVAGAHRLAATIKLGWKSIPCLIVDAQDDDTFTLIEIDENLTRGDLSQAERAIHIAKRKEIYERLHPQTKHGGAPGAGRGHGKAYKDANFASFQEDTAAKTSRSERSVTQDATRAKHIPLLRTDIRVSFWLSSGRWIIPAPIPTKTSAIPIRTTGIATPANRIRSIESDQTSRFSPIPKTSQRGRVQRWRRASPPSTTGNRARRAPPSFHHDRLANLYAPRHSPFGPLYIGLRVVHGNTRLRVSRIYAAMGNAYCAL